MDVPQFSFKNRFRLMSACDLCGKYHREPSLFCTICLALLEPLGAACAICALPLPDRASDLCGYCIRKKPAFDKVFTAYLFKTPLRECIHAFKYGDAFYLKKFLVACILDAVDIKHYETDCILPVPIFPSRLKKRGFNQAALLAKEVAKQLGKPCLMHHCQKIMATQSQMRLNRKERIHNVANAFRVKPLSFEKVTLVDDVLTTGTTVNALAALLKQQGVKTVDIFCCARSNL